MTRIRYWYDEARDGGEKYSAEEWIVDDMALNKSKTKLAPICEMCIRDRNITLWKKHLISMKYGL